MDLSSYSLDALFSVDGNVVVVTGGGTGLGKMIATAFATNGAKVYITGRRLEVLQKTAEEINATVKGKGSVIP
jgi:NADP-dependent 3-hydroxy acid dehydrogenase YdfG